MGKVSVFLILSMAGVIGACNDYACGPSLVISEWQKTRAGAPDCVGKIKSEKKTSRTKQLRHGLQPMYRRELNVCCDRAESSVIVDMFCFHEHALDRGRAPSDAMRDLRKRLMHGSVL